jgi:hypothetical protein
MARDGVHGRAARLVRGRNVSNVIVHRVDRGYGEIRVILTEWRGRLRADLRLWIRDVGPDEDPSGELRSTTKGVVLKLDDLPALLEAVRALVEAHERRRAA